MLWKFWKEKNLFFPYDEFAMENAQQNENK